MSENRNTRVPIIAAFLAGIAVAAIVAFIIFGQRDASARKNAAEPESNTKQETQAQAQAESPDAAQAEAGSPDDARAQTEPSPVSHPSVPPSAPVSPERARPGIMPAVAVQGTLL